LTIEKETGITSSYHHKMIVTRKRFYDFIDTPGHPKYLCNLVKGVYLADTAIVVVSVIKEE